MGTISADGAICGWVGRKGQVLKELLRPSAAKPPEALVHAARWSSRGCAQTINPCSWPLLAGILSSRMLKGRLPAGCAARLQGRSCFPAPLAWADLPVPRPPHAQGRTCLTWFPRWQRCLGSFDGSGIGCFSLLSSDACSHRRCRHLPASHGWRAHLLVCLPSCGVS
jgi:hypothetical protein